MGPAHRVTVNPDAFTREVLRAISAYPDVAYEYTKRPRHPPGRKLKSSPRRRIKTKKARADQQIAAQILKQHTINTALCKSLRSISNDAFEIAKAITPVLISLKSAGIVDIPLDAFLFATIALTIARTGISAICAEYD